MFHIVEKEERQVEFIELIYDLIFVYMVGQNISLISHVEHGFITISSFLTYFTATFAIIQIWNYTSYYINLYGKNGIRDHLFMFVNMYLMYFMGQGIHDDPHPFSMRYFIAWGLILLNITLQYMFEVRHHLYNPVAISSIGRIIGILLIEAACIFIFGRLYLISDMGPLLMLIPIFLGIFLMSIGSHESIVDAIDFPHLSERAMLYVVLTFGEMIIALASYFTEDMNLSELYVSIMTFLIVVGLFLCYEILYNKIIDREMRTNGFFYMFIHMFLVFSLNNITVALELMQEDAVTLEPKIIFLIGSFLLYFLCLFALEHYFRKNCRDRNLFRELSCVFIRSDRETSSKKTAPSAKGISYLILLPVMTGFVILMILFRHSVLINVTISVGYVFLIFFLLWQTTRAGRNESEDSNGKM